MAFRGGTTIQPSLGRLDFSGFEDAAMIDAESMVRIGASIAGAAKNYQKKKEEKEAQESFINIIEGFSEADNAVGNAIKEMGLTDRKSIAAATKGLGRKELVEMVNFFTKLGIEEEKNKFTPELRTFGEGENAVTALQTSPRQFQVISDRDEPRVPTGIQQRQDSEQTILDARRLYFEGVESGLDSKIQEANAKIASLDIYKDYEGIPLKAKDVFDPDKKPNVPLIFDVSTLSEADRQFYDKLSEEDKQFYGRLSEEDRPAFQFVKENPNDPRSKQILDGLNNVN